MEDGEEIVRFHLQVQLPQLFVELVLLVGLVVS